MSPPPFSVIFQELNDDPATLAVLFFFHLVSPPVIFHRHRVQQSTPCDSPMRLISQTDRLCTANQVEATKEIKAQRPLRLRVGTHLLSSLSRPSPSCTTTMAESPAHRLDLCIGGKYRLGKKIGSHSFGRCCHYSHNICARSTFRLSPKVCPFIAIPPSKECLYPYR